MELTHRLNKSNEVTSSETRELLQRDVEIQKKGISVNFILGFFVFLYKTAIKP
ncbi:hypothetical protein [Sphingobacterium prati]|uniref:hypothetical protein n=1 Tax=Sphingobacterium prati TaxID=2737006 RepID=UPI0015582C0B|nr:hypothetical protein [Sphingobacterium prati]NPE49191.1 hypothetical protein [Sphingobacterium prati]